MFVHKTLNKTAPSHFHSFFELHVPTHDHATRNDPLSGYSIPPGSVSLNGIPFRSFKYKCAQDWNNMLKTLSRTVGHTDRFINVSIPSLKRVSKAHFIEAY